MADTDNIIDTNTLAEETTASLNPLHLPEIVAHLGYFLKPKDLLNALLVNRTWHTLLGPFLWIVTRFHSRWVSTKLRTRNPSGETLRRNAHLIRYLTCPGLQFINHLLPRCCNLQELELSALGPIVVPLLNQNANSLKSLKQTAMFPHLNGDIISKWGFFTAIASLTQLRELHLEYLEIPARELYMFLKTCAQITTLHLRICRWTISEPQLDAVDFEHIQTMSLLKNVQTPMQELKFFTRCPSLRSLVWWVSGKFTKDERPHIHELLSSRAGNLRTFAIHTTTLDDNDIATCIEALPTLPNLNLSGSSLGKHTVQAILGRISNLVELDLCSCKHLPRGFLQQILASCPNLESFAADYYNVKMPLSTPWPCTHLQSLRLSFVSFIKEAITTEEYDWIYGQLAALTYLKLLQIGEVHVPSLAPINIMELSLAKGFGQLKTLTKLEGLWVGNMYRGLGTAESTWIKEHLPLATVYLPCNPE
ncbi:hypothetical protein BG011_005844 [Mortierella polycephala]|uniref:F-box domain-containing protein n=1 Tax=Mortierella polycephala TaxID=41804 RepID=A0A9P6QBI4_9FUNG|nr:hypothetical protein BG011_005844 [Mortierella polycephala]